MALTPGTKLGPYSVTAPIGSGGMGEVYRARDTRLSRDVALKIVPLKFASDSDRLRRFEQEARATGLLNHPNILQIYDIGTYEGSPYVVSELLEGETLRDRIGGTPVPTRKAIDFATQIALGLSAAHDKGIVHRDLKPDNLFVTRDGRVKILDFGLAKLTDGDALAEAETHTQGALGTDAGTVLGTVGYMSPEQVRAQPVDHRSDIFSFGSVLYEMLSGKRAFRAASAVETMNAILKEDPPELSETNRSLPLELERIVSHCLEKNPEERYQSARDIAFHLEQISGSSVQTGLVPPVVGRKRPGLRTLVAVAAMLALAASAFVFGRRTVVQSLPEFRPITFQRQNIRSASFAPDGRTVIYTAQMPGNVRDLFMVQPGSPESRGLGVQDAMLADISPSGELAILLRREGMPGRILARVPMGGGAPRDVAERITAADWAPDGNSFAVVRFEAGRNRLEFPIGKSLYEAVYIGNIRVSPRGDLVAFTNHPLAGDNRGDVEVVDLSGKKRTLSAGWADIRGLVWSPDGKEVWFSATRTGIELNLWGVSLDGHERQIYRSPGSMQIQDVRPDGRILVTVGRVKPSLYGLAPGEGTERDLSWLDWGVSADISSDGKTFLFCEQGDGAGSEYATYIRDTAGSAPVMLGKGAAFSLAPDGRSALVLNMTAPAHLDVLPTGAGAARPLPAGTLVQFHGAAFFPDGKRIAITGNEEGKAPRIWIQEIAAGNPTPLTPEGIGFGFSGGNPISPDGAFVAGETDAGLALYPVQGGEARPVRGSAEGDITLRFSRDGRYLYVQPNQAYGEAVHLIRIELATGIREPWKDVTPAGMSRVGRIGNIVVAPDAGAYAYTFLEQMTTLYEMSGLKR